MDEVCPTLFLICWRAVRTAWGDTQLFSNDCNQPFRSVMSCHQLRQKRTEKRRLPGRKSVSEALGTFRPDGHYALQGNPSFPFYVIMLNQFVTFVVSYTTLDFNANSLNAVTIPYHFTEVGQASPN